MNPARYVEVMIYDVVIVGGGPGGLAAALALGRGRKHVLLANSGTPRNAAAVHIHNFVTRDGTPPAEFRRIGREQLAPYKSVEVRDVRVEEIRGERGAFVVRLSDRTVEARRILLCTGMIDELPELEGFRELWGTSIFQCPYCHGWEVQDRRFGVLVPSPEMFDWALMFLGWSKHLVAFTDGKVAAGEEVKARFAKAGVRIEERPIAKLSGSGGQLERIELAGGASVELDVLFARPKQRHVPLVESLNLALDAGGYVKIDEMHSETSRSGIHAGGDLITPVQGAIMAAASSVVAAARLNHGLTIELALE